MYICHCHSLTSSQLTLPPPCVLKSILYVCVFIPVLLLGSSEPFSFFRFHVYVLAYSICFSELLHSGWQTLGPSTSLQITQFRFFLWLSNIPLYTCAASSLSIHVMNIVVHDSFWIMVFSGYMPSNWIAGLYGSSICSFLRNLHMFSIVAVSIYITSNSARGFPFLHTLSSIYCL